MLKSKKIEYYETGSGKMPVKDWLYSLNKEERNRVDNRLIRITTGNYGDCKSIKGSELKELRFDFSKGYRIYFTEINNKIVLLLNAGDKSTQTKDIKKAKEYLKDYKIRKG